MTYTDSFGYQWTTFRKTQLDDADRAESEETFALKTGLRPADVEGRTVLDVGCGMGRFADVVARWGAAEVVGMDMSRAVESMLKAAGFDVAMFFSAEALLEAQVPADAACLVLDVHLPSMTGFELYDRLTATHPPCPVIFMTAYDEPAARARSEEAKAVAFLVKPFAGKRLIECVRRAIRAKARD